MIRLIGLTVLLAAYWLLLSGHYSTLFLLFGAASVALTVWIARRMDIVDHEGRALELSLRAPGYWLWLLGQLLKSSWDVAGRIIRPAASVAPAARSVSARDMTEIERVTYANSITITPGTLSLKVGVDAIDVHALHQELIDDLDGGEMARRVRRMELG
jgi:multicomponent Na+:H+ antiporter subunit E